MNIAFQVDKHLACHMERWPHADRAQQKRRITAALKTGNAWLWLEPKQMALFA